MMSNENNKSNHMSVTEIKYGPLLNTGYEDKTLSPATKCVGVMTRIPNTSPNGDPFKIGEYSKITTRVMIIRVLDRQPKNCYYSSDTKVSP